MAGKKVLVLGGAAGANKYENSKDTKGKNWQEMQVPSCGEVNQEAREIALDVLQRDKMSPRLALA